jgi:hypothetical protein
MMKNLLRNYLLVAVTVILISIQLNAYATTGIWEAIGGPGAQFVCTKDNLYSLSPDKQGVFRYNGVPGSWTKVGGAAKELIGGGTYLYAISPSGHDIYRYTGTGETWETIGGDVGGVPVYLPGGRSSASGFQFVGTKDNLYSLSPDKQGVFRYNGVPGSWTKVGGAAKELIGGETYLYAISPTSEDIYRYTGAGETWEKIGGPGAQFVCTKDTLYGLSPDKQGVFRYNGIPGSWTKVGGPVKELIGGGTYLYAIFPTSEDIYRYTGAGEPWEKIGGPGAQFVAYGKNLFGVSTDGSKILMTTVSAPTFTPIHPADLRATAASSSSISLSWQDKSDNETGFKVFRKYGSYAYTLIATLPADTSSYLDKGIKGVVAEYTVYLQSPGVQFCRCQ